jgi:N6-adenosine-specific RNA methylase IME4/ParB-like chromosome segregation protein Spo0J
MTTPLQLFDALPAHIEDALRASIERFGVLVPVVRDQRGRIIDGHHRARIADKMGVTYRVDVVSVADDDEAREIARTLNTARRHLSGEQLREHIVMLARRVTPSGVGELSQNEIAQVAGVSRQYVGQVLNDPQLASTCKLPDSRWGTDGKVRPARRPTLVAAKDEREAEQAQQALATLDGTAEGTLTTREAVKLAARIRTPEPVAEPVAPPTGWYHCFVIDPPWPMAKIERDERPNQGVALDYPTMPIECQDPAIVGNRDIGTEFHEEYEPVHEPCFRAWWSEEDGYTDGYKPCRSIQCVVGHVVKTSTLDDAHIYLWVTHKFLPAGLDLLAGWGFSYQCVMTWRKNVGITPYSWMYDTEHVLFGRRGNQALRQLGLRLSFDAPVQGHSRKPDVFYERVVAASPEPRIEMFARTSRDGFTPWGNEVIDVGV